MNGNNSAKIGHAAGWLTREYSFIRLILDDDFIIGDI